MCTVVWTSQDVMRQVDIEASPNNVPILRRMEILYIHSSSKCRWRKGISWEKGMNENDYREEKRME